jgi:UDPglucose--hexose-1-phosphate uridylyltransferase
MKAHVNKSKLTIYKHISEFVYYGLKNRMIAETDVDYVNNRLSNLLKIEPKIIEKINSEINLEKIIALIIKYAIDRKVIENNLEDAEKFEALALDLLTPRPSQIIENFNNLYNISPNQATNYLYDLMTKNNYIKMERVKSNIKYDYAGKYGKLEITINVSKPEKNNDSVKKELGNQSKDDYPKCVLCKENVGFYGKAKFSGRTNHRIIPIKLNNETFNFQFSPYVYYQEHAIIFSNEHIPMKITKSTFNRLFDFIKLFPEYFIGSNAALPIVGGSILGHEHYQGGKYKFPIEFAKSFEKYTVGKVDIDLLNWPVSTIRIKSKFLSELIDLADKIRTEFDNYKDEDAGIIPYTKNVKHNTITPIARFNNGFYELDIALRNNRADKVYPDGIFHNHPEVHDVKKESIGLIEVMGLAILPGRLEKDLVSIENYLKGKTRTFDNLKLYPNLIKSLQKNNGSINQTRIRQVAAAMFEKGLEDCGVFKQNELGRNQFKKFIESKII